MFLPPLRCEIKVNNNLIWCPLCRPLLSLVLSPGPPVLPLFSLGTGGCQSGFMSSSLELKEVSFASCYGTSRPASQERWEEGPGEQGEQGAGPSPGGDQQWGSQCSFCVAAVGCVFGNYPPLFEHRLDFPEEIPTSQPTEECTTHRQQRLTSHSAPEMPDWERHGKYVKLSLVWHDEQSSTVLFHIVMVRLDRDTCKADSTQWHHYLSPSLLNYTFDQMCLFYTEIDTLLLPTLPWIIGISARSFRKYF